MGVWFGVYHKDHTDHTPARAAAGAMQVCQLGGGGVEGGWSVGHAEGQPATATAAGAVQV
jgi:hypothetical protein